MFNDDELTAGLLVNPARTQNVVLKELRDRMNGEVAIADPNNPFMFILEANSSMVAALAKRLERVNDGIYPVRAQTFKDLYRVMSDFDYADLMAVPASTEVTIMFDRAEIVSRAVAYNDVYSKLTIPEETVITIGSTRYSLYYPIDIIVDQGTESVRVLYNTDRTNPLYSLSSNLVEYSEVKQNGQTLLVIRLPVFQFIRERVTESIVQNMGINIPMPYQHKFMAARVFTLISGKWSELKYTLSETEYDPSVATARIKVQPERNIAQVIIPQIYLTSGLVKNSVRIDIFGTRGKIDIPITEGEAQSCSINFGIQGENASTDPYSLALHRLSSLQVYPVDTRVTGGRNAIDFDTLKQKVIRGSLGGNTVPVTPLELEHHVNDAGFTLTKYQDTITRRTYFANKRLLMSSGTPVPVTIGELVIDTSAMENIASVRSFDSGAICILPTTIYRYSDTSRQCTPLTDDEVTALGALSTAEYVDELNTTIYGRIPFHTVIYTDERYPSSKQFNLMTPKVPSVEMISDNTNIPGSMKVLAAECTHLVNGTGGYRIRLGVQKTSDIADVSEDDIRILLITTTVEGKQVYLQTTKTSETDTLDVYDALLATSYHITKTGHITVSMDLAEDESVEAVIPLDAVFQVALLVSPSAIGEPTGIVTKSVPTDFVNYLQLSRQRISVSFGQDLSDDIYNVTNTVWAAERYATYDEDVPWTYANDVYQTTDGVPDLQDDGEGGQELILLHSQGDTVLDEEDNPVIRYEAGTIKLDGDGNPIVMTSRQAEFYVESLLLDARLYAASGVVETAYIGSVAEEIASYLTSVAERRTQLLENTELYFRPVKTIGSTAFDLGNGIIEEFDLGLSFNVTCHVSRSVASDDDEVDTIKATVSRIIWQRLQDKFVSLTRITKDIQDTLGSAIQSVDSIGVNGTTIQTLRPIETGVEPTVALKLAIDTDGSLVLREDITVTIQPIDL